MRWKQTSIAFQMRYRQLATILRLHGHRACDLEAHAAQLALVRIDSAQVKARQYCHGYVASTQLAGTYDADRNRASKLSRTMMRAMTNN